MRDGEEGHVFDVGIMFRRICDDVMDVVIAFPPSDGKTTKEVRNEDADTCVNMEIMGYAHVACIMGGEDELMPEGAQESAGKCIPAVMKRQ
jgi:hypothetical protein